MIKTVDQQFITASDGATGADREVNEWLAVGWSIKFFKMSLSDDNGRLCEDCWTTRAFILEWDATKGEPVYP